MKKVILFASLLVFPYSAWAESVFLVESSTQQEFDEEKACDVYHRITRQLVNLGLDLSSKPRVRIHLVGRRRRPTSPHGMLGRRLRPSVARPYDREEKIRVAIVGISSKGVDVWLTQPDILLLAQALTVSLDYENHLYLEPPAIIDIASTAWRTHASNEKWKVTVQALRKGE